MRAPKAGKPLPKALSVDQAVALVSREGKASTSFIQRHLAIGYNRAAKLIEQMEKEGIVESSWETSKGGPARRMYTITDAGEAYLDFWARSLADKPLSSRS